MLRQLAPAIALLALSISVGALPWSLGTSTNSLSPAATPSFPATNSTDLSPAESPPQCDDIHSCRTLYDIVQSCVLTIFACVWVAVHHNMPPPRSQGIPSFPPVPKSQIRPSFAVRTAKNVWARCRRHALPEFPPSPKSQSESSIAVRTAQRLWIFGRGQSAIVIVVALTLPEMILAMALVQSFYAWVLLGKLNKARTESINTWMEHPRESNQTMDGLAKGNDALSRACMVARVNEPWTRAHAFLAIMGGFQFYDKDGPRYALDPKTVIDLVRTGEITAPTAEEVADRSKGDMLSKGLAVLQTLWFVVQCIGRRFEHLPVTNLEIITLAYTLTTVAMYIAWWEKPLNAGCVIRIPISSKTTRPEQTLPPPTFLSIIQKWLSRAIGFNNLASDTVGVMVCIRAFIDGTQDQLVKLEGLEGVPTFWTGMASPVATLLAHIVSIFVAVSFAAVHYIPWSYAFSSPLEQQLWRWSTVAITGVPVALLACLMLARSSPTGCTKGTRWSRSWWGGVCGVSVLAIGGPIYICARGILFALSFITLKSLPIAAYRIVEWTEFIPHI